MPIKTMDQKEQQAREMALALVDSPETEVTAEDIANWSASDVYTWLEIGWHYQWDEDNQWWFET